METRQARTHLGDARNDALNWGLIVAVVICVEFWIAVTSFVLDL